MSSWVRSTTDDSRAQQALGLHVERLMGAIESLLRQHGEGLSEHALIKALQNPPWKLLGQVEYADPTALYPVHFLVFHSLYRLREELIAEGAETLQVHPLSIRILAAQSPSGNQHPGEEDPLAHFYRDIANLSLTRDSINQMMDDFWRGETLSRPGSSELAKACDTLELDCPPESFQGAKRQFRRLAMQRHPDRGGSNSALQNLNQAMAIVRRHFGIQRAGQNIMSRGH